MRFLILFSLLLMSVDARAQSYLERKDADAIGVIERSLAKIDKIPQLFDGTRIPDGVDLMAVRNLYDDISKHLDAAGRSFNELSAKGASRPDVQKLRAKYDDLFRYATALGPVLQRALDDADNARRKKAALDQHDLDRAREVCKAFREEVAKNSGDNETMSILTNLVDGHSVFWQSAEEGAKYKAALERTAATCKRMPTAGASCARASNIAPLDSRFCDTAAKGDELLKAGVKNLIAHHTKHSGPTQILKDFDRFKGYVDVDGVIGWTAYFSGAALKERLKKQVAPLLAQANMSPTDGDSLFEGIAAEFAQLEAKAREAAPTWDLPGSACTGPGCAQAKKFVQQWYRGSTIKRFLHTQPGWKILTNELGVPTYRERYGHALVQVKGDPFCQLRMWTYSEQYAGGGRYTPGRDVHLHSVRWQTCK